MRFIEIGGKRFGRLLVIGRDTNNKYKNIHWLCKCDCGQEVSIYGSSLRGGDSTSCGCFQREDAIRRLTTHGKTSTSIYRVWESMRRRCNNQNDTAYDRYGGRGIKVCAHWNSFKNFYVDMGDRPEWKSLDRIDNNGNYELSNCRWATAQEQANNRRPRCRTGAGKAAAS